MNNKHIQSFWHLIRTTTLIIALLISDSGRVTDVGASSGSYNADLKQSDQSLKNIIYDDNDKAWIYNGSWSETPVRKAFGRRIRLSNKIGDFATISISSSRFTFLYSRSPKYGKLGIYVDGQKIQIINQQNSETSYQKEWTSPTLGSGSHTIKFVHESGDIVNVDAVKIRVSDTNPALTSLPAITETSTPVPTDILKPIGGSTLTEIPTLAIIPSSTNTRPVEQPSFTSTSLPNPTSSPTPLQIPTQIASPTPSQVPSPIASFTSTVSLTTIASSTATATLTPTLTLSPFTVSLPTLIPSGKIIITEDNQIVQNVRITSTNSDGIYCSGHSNIKIHNVAILYNGDNGIYLNGCDGATISNVNILFSGAPISGPNSAGRNCIEAYNSDNLVVNNVLAGDCSNGVYTIQSNSPSISFIKCVNMRGPFPRGQCVQFNQSNNFLLSDFYSINDINIAWTADNVNVYNSSNGTIQRGIIDGNNSPNGSGVVTEAGSSNVSISDVDVYHWCNCAFGTSNGTNVSFTRVHASDSYKPCTQGGPASGTGIVFISYNFSPSPPTAGTVFSQAQYWSLTSGNQILYDGTPSTITIKDIIQNNFTKRIPITPIVPSIN